MSKAKRTTGITFQKGRDLFKVCAGKHVGADGKLRPTIHWLGRDQEHALYAAFTIRKRWTFVQSSGRNQWSMEDLAAIKAMVSNGVELFTDAAERIARQRRELDAQEQTLREAAFVTPHAGAFASPDVPLPTTPDAPAPAPAPKLYAAIKAYLDSLAERRVSDGHRDRAAQVLTINLKGARADVPLAEVDHRWLESLANHFRSRPESLKEEGKRISAQTAAVILRYLKAFFIWLDDAEWGGWSGPRKLAKIFRCNATDLMSSVELKAAATIEQFDVATLRKLYAAADDFARRCMLLGLFAGCTQMELAVLEKSEFDLDNAGLHHFRNKTKVEGKFWLPPEAIDSLRKDFARRKRDSLAFRSPEGLPVVVFTNGKKTSDSVRVAWNKAKDAAKLPDALSFKYLRKFLADWMVRSGGDEMGQVAMSHARRSIVAKHYTSAKAFEKFNALQQQMYAELSAAKVFSGTAEDKAAKSARAKAA